MTKLSQRFRFDGVHRLGHLPAGEARTLTSPARFDGHIYGWGTESGLRFVVGDWGTSPYGAFTDVMVAHPDGRRELLAPTPEIARFVSTTYVFDSVRIVPVTFHCIGRRRRLTAGNLEADFIVGSRAVWGYPLRAIPRRCTSPLLARLLEPGARLVMPGVRTHGTAGGGRHEYYVAHDLHHLEDLDATWAGAPLGAGRAVAPDPHFGFSSTPEQPSCTAVTTFVAESRPSKSFRC